MSVLRTIEQKIEGLFEGVFGRAFRARVQPVELARKLRKEMDDHRAVSVTRIYVPNEYTVYLSPSDREQFATYEAELLGELEDDLAEHATREQYALLSSPNVLMETDQDLAVGEFGIATRMAQPERRKPEPGEPAGEAAPGATMVYQPRADVAEEAAPDEELGLELAIVTLTIDGTTHEIDKRRVLLGRAKDCDIQLADSNVSRHHAELRREGGEHWIVDLDSTNGTEVNGRRAKRAKLEDGDTITLGSTEIVFGRALP